jgi:DNA-binding response OmpR family regulator
MARLLVTDDDPQLGTLLSRLLTSAGHEVAVAENGKAALAYIDAHQVDLMLLDVLMPEQDGFETVMALSHAPARPRIIMMSGGSDRLGRSYLLSVVKLMAVDGLLDKPFTKEHLLELVDSVLAKGPVGPKA